MDPISVTMAITSLVGIGMSIFGLSEQTKAAKTKADIEQKVAGLNTGIAQEQLNANILSQKSFQADEKRRALETVRQRNITDALALSNSVASGSSPMGYSSALPGARGQIAGEANTNLTGLNQALMAGNEMYDINRTISGYRIGLAQYGADIATANSQAATGVGLTSLGGAVTSSASAFARIMGAATGKSQLNADQGYGAYYTYGERT